MVRELGIAVYELWGGVASPSEFAYTVHLPDIIKK